MQRRRECSLGVRAEHAQDTRLGETLDAICSERQAIWQTGVLLRFADASQLWTFPELAALQADLPTALDSVDPDLCS